VGGAVAKLRRVGAWKKRDNDSYAILYCVHEIVHTLGERSRKVERKRGLREHQILPSMSRPANPYDNATCESFIKTLKREVIYASEYRDFEDLLQSIEEFVDRYYNQCRLHSALSYCSPQEFEHQAQADSRASTGAMMTFFGR